MNPIISGASVIAAGLSIGLAAIGHVDYRKLTLNAAISETLDIHKKLSL